MKICHAIDPEVVVEGETQSLSFSCIGDRGKEPWLLPLALNSWNG